MDTKTDEIILKRLKSIETTVKDCRKVLQDIENQCEIMSYMTTARILSSKNPDPETL